ncbi:MAG: hypothetical protein ACRELV_02890 [Longimicrobiales bacterium]
MRATVVALLVGGAVILGLGYWAGKRQAGDARFGPQPPAALTMIRPAAGDTLPAGPTMLRFATSAPLELTPRGWMAGSYHLHAYVDGVEHMPGAADIRALDDGRFVWTLSLESGLRRLRLAWASGTHRALGTGSTAAITVHVRDASDED